LRKPNLPEETKKKAKANKAIKKRGKREWKIEKV